MNPKPMLKKILTYAEAVQFVRDNAHKIRPIYATKTFREIAEVFGIAPDNNFQKALTRELGPKGQGLGGARQGAGNRREKLPKVKRTTTIPHLRISPATLRLIEEGAEKFGVSRADWVIIAVHLLSLQPYQNCPICGGAKIPRSEIAGLDAGLCDHCGKEMNPPA